jgi:uncharacterized protein
MHKETDHMEKPISQTVSTPITQADPSLRTFMLSIFNRMTLALALSGAIAYVTSMIWGATLAGTIWPIVFALSPLAFVLVLSFGIHKLSYTTANLLFWLFAISMGLSLSSVFMMYTGVSIVSTFLITSATFASASLIGYTTQRDLTQMGTFLLMGLIGILIAAVVNMFLASSALAFVISVVGVLVFTGLTAYDCQNLKNDFLTNGEVYGFDSPQKSALYGALSLYLNFVNLFQMLLHLLGHRQE